MNTGKHKRFSYRNSNPAGRVMIDGRGRNVWQWNDEQLDSTSIVLKRLENDELALEPTRRLRKADGGNPRSSAAAGRAEATERRADSSGVGELKLEQTFTIKLGGGFDPYNRS